jgi:hypothetical protein
MTVKYSASKNIRLVDQLVEINLYLYKGSNFVMDQLKTQKDYH